jgi:hypothetical protein
MLYRLYLTLAFVGLVIPYAIVIPWVKQHGVDLPLFFDTLFASGSAAVFSADVLFSAAVFLIFVAAEGRRGGLRHLWIYPLLILTVGLCCALPLFLAQRERAGTN